MKVSIADIGRYAPERFMPAAELASLTGIPAEVIVEKLGLEGKHIAAPDEHVSDMCIAAARPLLERHDPATVDAVMYFGSHWKDHGVWQAATRIQDALGIEGFAFEAVNVSAGAPVALKIARDMLAADDDLRSILLVAASKESAILDYSNPRSRFMFTFGDGAAAVLLRKGDGIAEVLRSGIRSDGSFAHHVLVPGGGSVHPASHETVDRRMHFLDVAEPEEMKRRLDPVTIKRFVSVCREATERSGMELADVDWVLPIHMKPSIHRALLAELGVEPERSVYLDRYGHMSAVDPLLSLSLLRDAGSLNAGDAVLIVAAGTGYTWAATVLRWEG